LNNEDVELDFIILVVFVDIVIAFVLAVLYDEDVVLGLLLFLRLLLFVV
jgi:hypothetical protein